MPQPRLAITEGLPAPALGTPAVGGEGEGAGCSLPWQQQIQQSRSRGEKAAGRQAPSSHFLGSPAPL